MKGTVYLLCVLLLTLQLQLTQASEPGDNVKVNGMYLPVLFTSINPPTYVCYHFRKACYLPGVSSGWRGWYRKGFSGYFIHESWMYYVNKVRCPCLLPQPPTPSEANTSSTMTGGRL